MATLEKIPVLNPLTLRNTVGGELVDIFAAHGVENCESVLGIKNLRGKESLSRRIVSKAESILNIPDLENYLIDFEKSYLAEKPRYKENYAKAKRAYSQLKKVLPLLRGEFTDGYDELDDICDYFDVESVNEIFERSKCHEALFRKQNNIEVDPVNLYAWLRRGELDFKALTLPLYDDKGLTEWIENREWLLHIEDVNYFKSLPTILSCFGVGVIFVPSLPKTVYGAIRWFDGRPLIEISDRGHDLASCWFTLFHEFGHAIKHKDIVIYEGGLNEPRAKQDKREREANKFANAYLFNGDNLRKAVFERKRKGEQMSARALSMEFDVQPLFASYWLLKAQYAPAFQRRIQIDFVSDYQ